MLQRRKKQLIFLNIAIFTIAILFCGQISYILAEESANHLVQEISELDKQMEQKRKEVEALKKKSEEYKRNIESAKRKTVSLETELAIIANRIAKTEIDVEAAQKSIEQIEIEIKNLELQIDEKEKNINHNKERLANILRRINKNDQSDYLQIIITKESFSEVFDQIQYVKDLQSDLQGALNKIKDEKNDLEKKEGERRARQEEEKKNKDDLVKLQESLKEQTNVKEVLLSEAFASEKKFQNWLLQAKYEQAQINSEIYSIEKNIRQKLEQSDDAFSENQGISGEIALSWPVDPSRGITALFHDPDYPYRNIFEHPAIDLRAYQGTPVKAAAPGYVARVKNGGRTGYSYVMIIHANNVSTVYGHLSRIDVQEDTYVIRGQVIGLSGGAPGTSGAGRFSTGPHLHFETRLKGIPVNPLNYLP